MSPMTLRRLLFAGTGLTRQPVVVYVGDGRYLMFLFWSNLHNKHIDLEKLRMENEVPHVLLIWRWSVRDLHPVSGPGGPSADYARPG